jgi:hypothetical protein
VSCAAADYEPFLETREHVPVASGVRAKDERIIAIKQGAARSELPF